MSQANQLTKFKDRSSWLASLVSVLRVEETRLPTIEEKSFRVMGLFPLVLESCSVGG